MTTAHSGSPPRWPGELYEQAATRIGRACYRLLLLEERWVHRRTETISILSRELAHRSVSVDLTVPELFRPFLKLTSQTEWLVPLATLRKKPLRNFDLRDERGRAIPVVGRQHNGPIAHAVLLAAARSALRRAAHGDPSSSLVSNLEQVATAGPADAEEAIGEMEQAAGEGNDEHQIVLSDDATVFLLADLADNYILLGVLDDVEHRRVLKYAYDHELERAPERAQLPERLGWQPLLIDTVTPAAGRAGSYHAEVAIPDELRIEGSFIYDEESSEVYANDGEADRASLYAPDVPLGARSVLLLGIRAERAGFPVVAFVVAWIVALLLLFGATIGDLKESEAGPTTSVLLAASAVFAGVVARAGEHRLVQALYATPRSLLVVSAISALVAAAALGFGVRAGVVQWTWNICAGISILMAAILTITCKRASPTTRTTG